MKKTRLSIKILLAILTLSIPTYIYAEETSVSDILGDQEINEEVIAELDNKEEEREYGFENQLLLQIPELTDNPSHILTFTDPSQEQLGVQLEIDSTKYIEIESPYALPALSIGEHVLKFKFTDKEGTVQTLEKELTVIPRPPIVNTPQVTKTDITISGTGLANAEVIVLLTSGSYNTTKTVDIQSDGTWTHTFEIEDQDNTLYNVSAYTRKYGFASNLSEVLTFNTDSSVITTKKNTGVPTITFSIESLADPIAAYTQNLDFSIYTAIIFVLGGLVFTAISTLFKNGREASKVKEFKKQIDNKKPASKEKGMTLKERLSQEAPKSEVKPKKEEKKKKLPKKKETPKKTKKEEPKEKVVSKNQFMKDFKNFDPDNAKGKEKKVKISLTSKKE